MNIKFETMVAKQEKLMQYEKMIKGLKLFFDYATIDEMKLYRQLGKKKHDRFRKAWELLKQFPDEV